MKKVKTTQGRAYVVTAATVPCRISSNGIELALVETVGQVSFVAIEEEIDVDQDDAVITPVFKGARLGLSAKGGVKEFYITVASDGVMTPCHSKFLENGASLFINKAIQGGIYVFERCINAAGMFQGASSPSGKIDISLPKCTIFYGIFSSSKFEEVTIDAPLVTVSSICPASPLLRRLNCNFPRLQSPTSFASNTPSLKYVTPYFPALLHAPGMFLKSGLEAQMINEILACLPRYTTGTHIITFTGCPGAATCSPEIATIKGWTVEI